MKNSIPSIPIFDSISDDLSLVPHRAAFIPFIVAGHPNIEISLLAVDALVEAGADALELGVPFSDALADGPVIQAASEVTSKKMDSMVSVLEFAEVVNKKHPDLPLILFSYFNPIFKMGISNFSKKAAKKGIRAVLVVDLPPEEASEYRQILKEHQLETIFLAAPNTSDHRLRLISQASTGFIYYVSRLGVTGVQSELSDTLEAELMRVKSVLREQDASGEIAGKVQHRKRIAVGFGISNGEQAEKVARISDAVVVGSAFVRILSGREMPDVLISSLQALAHDIVRGITKAVRIGE